MRSRFAAGVVGMLSIWWVAPCPLALGQATATWFDINPSTSNLDPDDPNGASGGRVHHVSAAADFSRVYAATEWGGLYQSFDQGNTWVQVNSFAPSATWDVKVDPANALRVYVTSFYDGRVNPQSGISISDDAGGTWRNVNFGLNTLGCTLFGVNAEPTAFQIAINGRAVFAGTNCGLARSTDGGANWDFIDPTPGNSAEPVFSVIAHGNRIVDVISNNGHTRSTDNGGTWSALVAAPGPVAGVVGLGANVAVSPRENWVLLAQMTQSGVINIWESDDAGATWPTSLTPPLLSRNGQPAAQGRIPFVKTNQLSTSNQFDVWYGDVNLYKTTAVTPSTLAPGGAPRTPVNSWTDVQDQGHWDVGDVLFDPRFSAGSCPSLFTNDGGVYRNLRTTPPDCQRPSWEQPTISPHATWTWSLDGSRSLPGLHNVNYGLQDNGGWAATLVFEGHNPPLPNWNNFACCDIFDNSDGAGAIMTIEGFSPPPAPRGFTYHRRNRDGGGDNEIPNYPTTQNVIAFNDRNQSVPFGGTGYVLNMQDGALPPSPTPTPPRTGDVYFTNNITSNPIAWTSLNSPTAATTGTGSIKVANLSGFPNVYYHTGPGNVEIPGVIFRSTLVGTTAAPGSNWAPLPLPGGVGSVTAWDVDPNDGNRVIVAYIPPAQTTFQIQMTQDFGANWTRLTALENAMLSPGGVATFRARANGGPFPGTGFGTYWQPSLLKFNPLDSSTIIAGAFDAGVFLSLDDGASWQSISNAAAPSSTSPNIPRPIHAYFSPGRFAASTNAFDVWVGTRGAGVRKVVLETPRGD